MMNRNIYVLLDTWKLKNERKPLVLRGARQVGKTYGVKFWSRDKFTKVIYLNFEKDQNLAAIFEGSLDVLKILNKLENYLGQSVNLETDLIFFDEIQICGKALNSLKYFSEEFPTAYIIAAGSLLGLVLNEEPFPVGKVEFLDVFPMTFQEFLEAQNKTHLIQEYLESQDGGIHEKLCADLKNYLITGGAPEIVKYFIDNRPSNFEDFEILRKMQEDLLNSHIADMAKHCGKNNAMHIERIWRNIPSQLAKADNKRFIFKNVLPKKNKYSQMVDVIDWLEAAGLIYRVQVANQGMTPLAAYTKESHFKLYLFDVGVLSTLSGLHPLEILNYNFGTFKGYLLENFVLQELRPQFGNKIYSWAEGASELDFILSYKTAIVPIEVKAGVNLKAKSLKNFVQKYKSPFALRLSLENKMANEAIPTRICDRPVYLAGVSNIFKLNSQS